MVMTGDLPAVTVTSAGTGAVYLSGASGTVAVDVSGVSNVYIVGAGVLLHPGPAHPCCRASAGRMIAQ